MRCEDAVEQISTGRAQQGGDLRAAMAHAEGCEDCRAALRALDALRPLRVEPAPVPSDGAMERAIDRALASNPAKRYRRGFLSGLAAGAALAATVAAVAVGLWLRTGDGVAPSAVPEVRMALNQPRDVTVTVESPEALMDAEVRVELRGALALDGYAGQRELRWMTDLVRGVNELTLPVIALDATGGQVLVEVAHGDKRRAFVLDVRGGTAG
jgi:hypothetical protein